MIRKYNTEEERKQAHREVRKQYYKNNREKELERQKQYYKNNREKELERCKQYRDTPIGRATYLLKGYRRNDKKHNRGECTLKAQWIVDNIFSQPCHYCGESDWRKLGCDRIDNSLSHTPDNVVCCCAECNKKKGTTPYKEYLSRIGKRKQPVQL